MKSPTLHTDYAVSWKQAPRRASDPWNSFRITYLVNKTIEGEQFNSAFEAHIPGDKYWVEFTKTKRLHYIQHDGTRLLIGVGSMLLPRSQWADMTRWGVFNLILWWIWQKLQGNV